MSQGHIRRRPLSLELASMLVVGAAGMAVFVLYASLFTADPLRRVAGDHTAFSVASKLRDHTLVDIAKVVTDAGSLPFVGALVAIGSVVLLVRRRPLELLVLAGGFGLLVLGAHLAKVAVDRPRPSGALVHTITSSYPSGHATYATMYVAMAVIASRVLGGLVSRAVLILVGVLIAVVIGATRIYLRAHYLSDVLGGLGLGLAILAACGIAALVVAHIRHNATAGPPPA